MNKVAKKALKMENVEMHIRISKVEVKNIILPHYLIHFMYFFFLHSEALLMCESVLPTIFNEK